MKVKSICILMILLLCLSGCNVPVEEKETAAIDEYITETPKVESDTSESITEDIFSDDYKDYFVCRFEFLYKSTFLRFYDQKHYESLLGEDFTVKTVVKEKNDAGKKVYVVSAATPSKEALQSALCTIDADNNVELLTLEYSAHRVKKEEVNPMVPRVSTENEAIKGRERYLLVWDNYRVSEAGIYNLDVTLKDIRIFSLSDFKEFEVSHLAVKTRSNVAESWIRLYTDESFVEEQRSEALQAVNKRLGINLSFDGYLTEVS